MSTNNNKRNATGSQGFQQAWTRTFGRSAALPKANRWLVLSVAIVSLLGAGVAMAAWQVNDPKTQDQIKQTRDELSKRLGNNGNVNEHLDNVNRKLRVSKRSSDQTPEMVKEPTADEKLDAQQLASMPVNMEQLCVKNVISPAGLQQNSLCEERVKTELAQYRFSMRMFERAKENYDRLKKIEDKRRNLDENDYANVQYNTNELLALTALMDNDRDRYRTYMSAYEARIQHINNSQAALTRNALKGTKSITLPSL